MNNVSNTSLHAHVDSLYGNDAIAMLENPDLKFKTLTAAYNAVGMSGRPGTWTYQLYGGEHSSIPVFDRDSIIQGSRGVKITSQIRSVSNTVKIYDLSIVTDKITPFKILGGNIETENVSTCTGASPVIDLQPSQGAGTFNRMSFIWKPSQNSPVFVINESTDSLLIGWSTIDIQPQTAGANMTVYQNKGGGIRLRHNTFRLQDVVGGIVLPSLNKFVFFDNQESTQNNVENGIYSFAFPNRDSINAILYQSSINNPNFNMTGCYNTNSNNFEVSVTNSGGNCDVCINVDWSQQNGGYPLSNDPDDCISTSWDTTSSLVNNGGLHLGTVHVSNQNHIVSNSDYGIYADTSNGPVTVTIPEFDFDVEGRLLVIRNKTPCFGPITVMSTTSKINNRFKNIKVKDVVQLQHTQGVWWTI